MHSMYRTPPWARQKWQVALAMIPACIAGAWGAVVVWQLIFPTIGSCSFGEIALGLLFYISVGLEAGLLAPAILVIMAIHLVCGTIWLAAWAGKALFNLCRGSVDSSR